LPRVEGEGWGVPNFDSPEVKEADRGQCKPDRIKGF